MQIKTGNAILIAFFTWLCYDVPKTVWMMAQAYNIKEFYGLSVDNWVTIAFILPFIFALVCAASCCEHKKPEPVIKEKRKPVVEEKKPVQIVEPVKETENKSINKDLVLQDVQEELDKIALEKKEQ